MLPYYLKIDFYYYYYYIIFILYIMLYYCGSEINCSGNIMIGVHALVALLDRSIQMMYRVVSLLRTILLHS